MKQCPSCGAQFADSKKYCQHCGKPLMQKTAGSTPDQYRYSKPRTLKEKQNPANDPGHHLKRANDPNTNNNSKSFSPEENFPSFFGKRSLSFYEKSWFILLCLICCWPLAIVFLLVRLYRDQTFRPAVSTNQTYGTSLDDANESKEAAPPLLPNQSNKKHVIIGSCLMTFGVLCFATAFGETGSTMAIAIAFGLCSFVGGLAPLYLTYRANQKAALYESLIDNRGNTHISQIAERLNKSEVKVRTELQQLLNKGFLSEPQNGISAYIDGNHDLIVVTQRGVPFVPIEKSLKEKPRKAAIPKPTSQNSKTPATMEEQLFVTINQALANIYDEQVADFLNRIGKSVIKIKALTDEHKELENKQSIRNMRNTYIPNTIDLIEKYQKPTTSDRMKEEIKEMFSTTVIAFENIEKQLYESTEMETEIDIEVMKKTFERDGLLQSDFDIK